MSKNFKTYFQASWLQSEKFSSWLKATTDPTKAHCVLCRKDFNLSTMGIGALHSHATSAKHEASLIAHRKKSQNQLKVTDMIESLSQPQTSLHQPQTSFHQPETSTFFTSPKIEEESLKAQIMWTLKAVTSHFSMSSCSNIQQIFQVSSSITVCHVVV